MLPFACGPFLSSEPATSVQVLMLPCHWLLSTSSLYPYFPPFKDPCDYIRITWVICGTFPKVCLLVTFIPSSVQPNIFTGSGDLECGRLYRGFLPTTPMNINFVFRVIFIPTKLEFSFWKVFTSSGFFKPM